MCRKIVTDYVCMPLPERYYDWCAWFEGDEPNGEGLILEGWGETEEDAIEALMSLCEEG